MVNLNVNVTQSLYECRHVCEYTRLLSQDKRQSNGPEEIIADVDLVANLFREQNLGQATVKQLKNFLRHHKQKVSGRKAALLTRVASLLDDKQEHTSPSSSNQESAASPSLTVQINDDQDIMPPPPPESPSHASPPLRSGLSEAVMRASMRSAHRRASTVRRTSTVLSPPLTQVHPSTDVAATVAVTPTPVEKEDTILKKNENNLGSTVRQPRRLQVQKHTQIPIILDRACTQ